MGDSMFDNDSTPPRFATELLRRCTDPAQLEEVTGDLFEIYQRERFRMGRRRAAVSYWVQVMSIALRYLLKAAREPGLTRVATSLLYCASTRLFTAPVWRQYNAQSSQRLPSGTETQSASTLQLRS
jgi:hypothetical protein